MNGIIYLFVNKANGKCYVGQTTNEARRYESHRYCCKESGSFFHKAIKKYGFINFDYVVLHRGIKTRGELNFLETLEIKKHFSFHPGGYNLTTGGDCTTISDETKTRMSKSRAEYFSKEENRLRYTNIKRKTLKPVMRMDSKEVFVSIDDASRKTGNTSTGIRRSAKYEGEKAGGISFRFIDEHGSLVPQLPPRDNRSRPILCNDTGIVYKNALNAATSVGVTAGAIRAACVGTVKKCKGLSWSFYET